MHLSIFYRKVLALEENGLIYKNIYYSWSNISQIEIWQQEWPGFGWVPDQKLLPRASVTLTNGKHILLRGDALIKRGMPLEPGFSSAFDELVSVLKEKYKEATRKRHEDHT